MAVRFLTGCCKTGIACVRNPESGCGYTENACRPGTLTDTGDTSATDGACAATEAARCTLGGFVNKSDVTLQNGVCGPTQYVCSVGDLSNRTETQREYLWNCIGVDHVKLWQCDGIDGAKNWTCTSGDVKQCSVPDAATDANCSETATEATDDDCSICKRCTGGHEELGSNCSCVCESGYHRHNGQCVENPGCGRLVCADGNCNHRSDNDIGSCTQDAHYQDVNDTDTHFRWQCTNGGMTSNCVGDRPDPPRSCSASSVTWTVGNHTCEASLLETNHGSTATVIDSTINSGNLKTGSATFTCSEGDWGSATNATCECGDECACLLGGNVWMEAQPERPRTCTGNDACTPGSHRHSCTTPADPNGGYTSCDYERHRGGLRCAAHRTETCEPIPAVPAHCHVELPPCEICCEFGQDEYCP